MITLSDKYLDIAKIADSGQVFRFNRTAENEFLVIAGDRQLKIMTEENGKVSFACTEKEFKVFWKNYFDLDTDYSVFEKNIPESDSFLNAAAKYSKGIRILNQDPWEMLISFIISQRKSIPAIKISIEKMCTMFGKKLDGGTYAFPEPEELAQAGMDDLLSCSVGYRAEYIYRAAREVADGKKDLYAMRNLSDEALKENLLEFRGVGEKVANCVMLFGYHRIGAFPIDVWIQKMINEHYDGEFPIDLYAGYAGIIQQYIFFYGRETSKIR